MSSIPDHYPYTYDSQIQSEFQQMTSRVERAVGEVHSIPEAGKRFQISSPSASKAYTRGWNDSNPSQPDRRERWLDAQFYNPQEWVDRLDAMRLGQIGDPTPDRVKNLMAVANRDKDLKIIAGLGGDAKEGPAGNQTTVAFPAANVIDKDIGAADSGMNYDKFLEATTLLGAYNVTGQAVENQSNVALVCTHFEIKDMLNDAKFIDQDLSPLRRAALGQVTDFQGITIIPVSPDMLTIDGGTSVRTCYFFAKDAVAFGLGCAVKTNVDEVPVKNYSILLDLVYGYGFTRIKDEGVWKVESARTAAQKTVEDAAAAYVNS